MSKSNAVNWCFTINNPEGLLDFDTLPPHKYCVYQEEIGENGTLHFQGYVIIALYSNRHSNTHLDTYNATSVCASPS